MSKVLFLVPAQYSNAYQFLAVAQDIRKTYYSASNTIIFQMVWDGKETMDPKFQLASGVSPGFSKTFWSSLDASDTLIIISHNGLRDGPMIGPDGQQPWHTVDEKGMELTEYAAQFWRRISWSLGSGGTIMLAGCFSANMYGPLVAKLIPTINVFGFTKENMLGYIEKSRNAIGEGFVKGHGNGGAKQCK